ncbi:MAG: hypothetical protein QOF60_1389 [Actinomycetota bacterium]|jgi:hypothetical protein|nr:hypothetical protein [Actinomycetota bacterium]
MTNSLGWFRLAVAGLLLAGVASVPWMALAADEPSLVTPKAVCGPGSNPETGRQGRVPKAEVDSGRAKQGYTCNTQLVGHFGDSGGYKVERYVDGAGHECAFYDTTLLFPANATNLSTNLTGAFVLDMSNPADPKKTMGLVTPAMQSPHESMLLNPKRGLLAAVTANPLFYPGVIDVYDVSHDCRTPTPLSSLPLAGLGHESGWSPDGLTFYSSSLYGNTVVAIDLTNPAVPKPLAYTYQYRSHGLTISDDGNRAYLAVSGVGLVVLDVSDIQARKPSPQMREISRLTWPVMSTPQVPIPITIGGHPYIMEIDEFGSAAKVGAARIIDMADETKPKVISNLRLEVNAAEAQADPSQTADNGVINPLQGYTGHYCTVPQRVDPGVVACTFILSGLRLFDIRDPYNPKEIAYFNAPIGPGLDPRPGQDSSYAMSSASFVPARSEIWYSDGNSGFWAFKVTNGVWPFATASGTAGTDSTSGAVAASAAAGGAGSTGRGRNGALPATGPRQAGALATSGLALAVVFGVRGVRRRLLLDGA